MNVQRTEISNIISPGDFNKITLHICLSALIFLMLGVSISVDLNSQNAITYPRISWDKIFICCYVSIKYHHIFWFKADCFSPFLLGLAWAPLIASPVDKPLCTCPSAGSEVCVWPSARLAACFSIPLDLEWAFGRQIILDRSIFFLRKASAASQPKLKPDGEA